MSIFSKLIFDLKMEIELTSDAQTTEPDPQHEIIEMHTYIKEWIQYTPLRYITLFIAWIFLVRIDLVIYNNFFSFRCWDLFLP